MRNPATIRALGLLLPAALTWCLYLWRKPDGRAAAGALLASVWNLPTLLCLHLLAAHFGWWRFQAQGGLFFGFPVDLYTGWALLWGAIPALAFPRLQLLLLITVMLSADLLLMPASEPVVELGRWWLIGEACALGLCLLPAQLLARWTRRGDHLSGRATLQVVAFSALMLWLLPSVIMEQTGGSWRAFLNRPMWMNSLGVQLLCVPALLGLSAVQEFVTRGRGTPVPYDPPMQLVTSGLYAYVSNPMQLAMCLMLAGWGFMLQSLWVAAAGVMAFVYCAGLAAWDEGGDLSKRYGRAWILYRQQVRRWWPRWRPSYQSVGRLYVAEGCGMCSDVGAWLRRRKPIALEIAAAEDHPKKDLRRMTYQFGEGAAITVEEGVAAFARALEHVHLGYALAGSAMRLPAVRHLLQLMVDATGGGPRAINRRPTIQHVTSANERDASSASCSLKT